MLPVSRDALLAQGPHGLTEMMYAFTSAANNNGSAFAGLSADQPFLNLALGLHAARPVRADRAGAGAGRCARPAGTPAGDRRHHAHPLGELFAGLLIGIILIVAGLTYFPSLALGPIAEALS